MLALFTNVCNVNASKMKQDTKRLILLSENMAAPVYVDCQDVAVWRRYWDRMFSSLHKTPPINDTVNVYWKSLCHKLKTPVLDSWRWWMMTKIHWQTWKWLKTNQWQSQMLKTRWIGISASDATFSKMVSLLCSPVLIGLNTFIPNVSRLKGILHVRRTYEGIKNLG